MDLALKSERIADLSGKSNVFAAFEGMAKSGSSVSFGLDFGLYLSINSDV